MSKKTYKTHYSLKAARAEAAALRAQGIVCKIIKYTPPSFSLCQTASYYLQEV